MIYAMPGAECYLVIQSPEIGSSTEEMKKQMIILSKGRARSRMKHLSIQPHSLIATRPELRRSSIGGSRGCSC